MSSSDSGSCQLSLSINKSIHPQSHAQSPKVLYSTTVFQKPIGEEL